MTEKMKAAFIIETMALYFRGKPHSNTFKGVEAMLTSDKIYDLIVALRTP